MSRPLARSNRRSFWLTLAAYELVWVTAVAGAGRGSTWPGLLGTAAFAAWRLRVCEHRSVEARLVASAVAIGLILEGLWVHAGLVRYAAAWPLHSAPAWLIGLWVAFALTIVPLFGFLRGRPLIAAALGAVGGPLAYLGAARGWHALSIPRPAWHTLLALAAGWAIALPLLTGLAQRWLRGTRSENAT